MKLTKDGKYAYRKDPHTPVQVEFVDDARYSIVSMSEYEPLRHNSKGRCFVNDVTGDYDLVPLQRKARVFWVNEYPGGARTIHDCKSNAIIARGNYGTTIKVVEEVE